MPPGSKICPACRALNSADVDACMQCGKKFPGPLTGSVLEAWRSTFGTETPVTRLVIGFCIGVYALAGITGADLWSGPSGALAYRWGALTVGLVGGEPWRLLSACFLHFGIIHLGMNLMMLVFLGKALEPVLGSPRFSILLIASGVAGFVLSCVIDWWLLRNVTTGGLSGALYGLLGGLILQRFLSRDPGWKQLAIVAALYTALFAVALNVNHAAHAGGALAGLVLAFLFLKQKRREHREGIYRYLAGVLIGLSLLSVLLANASDTWLVMRAFEIQREGLQPVFN